MSNSKTDRRIVRTKEAILNAFQELFLEKEFERITINDIADRANVNRATIYLHYMDKYDIFDQCVEDILNKMFISCAFSKTTQEKITSKDEAIAALTSLFDYIKDHHHFFSRILFDKTASFRNSLLKISKSTVQTQLNLQRLNKEIDSELVTQYLASALVGTMEWWIRNDLLHAPPLMAQQVYHLLVKNEVFTH